jgi:hypothetical protein
MRRLAPLIVLAVLAGPATAAASVTVDTNSDATPTGHDCTPAPADCSLRQAISMAAPHGTVLIPASVEKITVASPLVITRPLTIRGAGIDTTVVSGGDRTRVLRIDVSGPVTLARLRIGHGRASVSGTHTGGAGILNQRGDLTLDHVRVQHNRLTATGGGTGGASVVQGGAGIFSQGPLTIRHSKVYRNDLYAMDAATSEKGGGGVLSLGPLQIGHSDVSRNTAALAGDIHLGGLGVFHLGSKPAVIVDTDVNSNSGSVNTGDGGESGGGGLYALRGELHLVRSAVVGNDLGANGPRLVGGAGIFANALLTLVNSTLDGNHLFAGSDTAQRSGGGALYLNGTVGARIVSSTIAHSVIDNPQGGAILNNGVGEPQLQNTIVANQDGAPNCVVEPDAGVFRSLGHNLESANDCGLDGPGDHTNTYPEWAGAPQFGPTWTPSVPNGLTAVSTIGRGDPDACPARDQRGVRRPQGEGCDVGAAEVLPPLVRALPPVVGARKATLAAMVTSDAGGAHLRLEYGRTSFGNVKHAPDVSAFEQGPIEFTLEGLQPGTTYRYRFVVSNLVGTVASRERTFTTQ